MYLKQKLKQRINLALFYRACLVPEFLNLAPDWNGTTQQQKTRKGRGCVHVGKRESKAMLRTIQQTCECLSVSRATVYRLIGEGRITRVYVRGVPRITEASLAHLLGERNG